MNRNFANNVGTGGGSTLPSPVWLDPSHDPLMSDREVASFLGVGRSTVWHWVSVGVIPRPLKLGGLSRWRQSTIQNVIERAEVKSLDVA
ncbi:MAG: helix-turn-helix domain-containing protein [Pseudomonadota bacterium]